MVGQAWQWDLRLVWLQRDFDGSHPQHPHSLLCPPSPPNSDEIIAHARSPHGLRLAFPPGTPVAFASLADRCMSRDPSARPACEDVRRALAALLDEAERALPAGEPVAAPHHHPARLRGGAARGAAPGAAAALQAPMAPQAQHAWAQPQPPAQLHLPPPQPLQQAHQLQQPPPLQPPQLQQQLQQQPVPVPAAAGKGGLMAGGNPSHRSARLRPPPAGDAEARGGAGSP